jgi:4-amino-4-deoxy-L-arabinose transferase-like glycosyltransferase
MLVLLTLYRALEKKRWYDYATSGAAFGLAVLVRSTIILFPLLLLAYLLVSSRARSWHRTIGEFISLVLAMFLVVSPWIVRNYSLTGKFIPTASVLGVSAHAGFYNNTHSGGTTEWVDADTEGARQRKRAAQQLGYRFKDVTNSYYEAFYYTSDEIQFSNDLLNWVKAEYEARPILFLENVWKNFFNLWFRGKTRTSTAANLVAEFPYLALGLAGVVLCIRSGLTHRMVPALLLLGYMIAVYVCILAQARYSVPLLPIVCIFAAMAIDNTRQKFRSRKAIGTSRLLFAPGPTK